MRICYLADGESVHTQRWLNYFANKGHDVHLVTVWPFEVDNLQNVKLHRLNMIRGIKGVNPLYAAFQIKRVIKSISPHLLHGHFVVGYGFWGALCRFHPFVLTAWGSDILVKPRLSNLTRWMVQFALRRADLITCDAEHLAEKMLQLGASKEKIQLIYYGTDIQRFSPKRKDPEFKVRLQIGPDSPTVISLRSLRPLYDVESLVKAIPRVLSEVPEAKFLVIGDGEQRSYLDQLATSLGVSKSVKFIGWIPNDELPRYLASVDVYVSTALSDGGLAASTAEAMASELPVVITDFGDNRKWVKDEEGGCIVPPKNPTVLSERIIYLLKNEDVRRRFGKINRRVIEERHNYDKEMVRMEHTYKQLMKEHTR